MCSKPSPWVLAFAVIGLEIAYVLTEGDDRRAITIAVVIVFFLASTIHALAWRGALWTLAFLVIAVGGGLAVEALGVHTGWPFGELHLHG